MGSLVSGSADAPRFRRSVFRGFCVGALALAGLAAYAGLGGGFGRFSGSPLAGDTVPALSLVDDKGRSFSLASLHGRAALVYFGYVRCPDVCPMVLDSLKPVFSQLGADADKVRVVFVTLDPKHDTPRELHDFLSNFDPTPIGVTGEPGAVAQTAKAWGIAWSASGGAGRIDHTSVLTLVGPAGRAVVRYGMTQLNDPAGMASDIRVALRAG
ncbi:electron transport transmembrane protein SenC/PrrC [Acetobacter nitrogenifigens DSM 23921 = NBRC 105050]|nr:electron transport transmembrane protein SenC/PrrC [Acetobacter nitrogenifigens DSM 23921 = NBRC 105050]